VKKITNDNLRKKNYFPMPQYLDEHEPVAELDDGARVVDVDSQDEEAVGAVECVEQALGHIVLAKVPHVQVDDHLGLQAEALLRAAALDRGLFRLLALLGPLLVVVVVLPRVDADMLDVLLPPRLGGAGGGDLRVR
jgi:hypothetical protein